MVKDALRQMITEVTGNILSGGPVGELNKKEWDWMCEQIVAKEQTFKSDESILTMREDMLLYELPEEMVEELPEYQEYMLRRSTGDWAFANDSFDSSPRKSLFFPMPRKYSTGDRNSGNHDGDQRSSGDSDSFYASSVEGGSHRRGRSSLFAEVMNAIAKRPIDLFENKLKRMEEIHTYYEQIKKNIDREIVSGDADVKCFIHVYILHQMLSLSALGSDVSSDFSHMDFTGRRLALHFEMRAFDRLYGAKQEHR